MHGSRVRWGFVLAAILGALLSVTIVHGALFDRFRPRPDRSPYGSVDVPESARHRIVGSVVGTSNDWPMEGATVHMVRASGLKVHTVRTERSNKFDFSVDAVPGGYFVQAYVNGYTMGQTYVELTADDLRNDVVVRLTPWTIYGTVRSGADAAPSTQPTRRRLLVREGPPSRDPVPNAPSNGVIEGASVQLLQLDLHNILPPTPFGAPILTGADGKFYFNVARGYKLSNGHRYALEVTSPTGWTSIELMPVPALPKGQQSIRVDPVVFPFTIFGQVQNVDDGSAVAGASVQLMEGGSPVGDPAIVEEYGQFKFYILNGFPLSPSNVYTLEVTSPAGWSSIDELSVPALSEGNPSVQVDPVISPFTISGEVQSADDNSPVPGASVQLTESETPVGAPIVVGADGQFKFNVLNGYTLDPTLTYALDVTAPDVTNTWTDLMGVSVPEMTNEFPVVTVNPSMALECQNGNSWDSAGNECLCTGGDEGRWCEDAGDGCYIDTDIMYLALTPRVQGVIDEHSISDAIPFTLALPKEDVGESITCTGTDATESTCVVTMVPLMMRYVRPGDSILVVSPENKVELNPVITMGHKIDDFQMMYIATVNFKNPDGSMGFIDLTTNHMLNVRPTAGSLGDAFEAGTGPIDFFGYSGALSNSHLQLASTLEPGQQIWIQEFPTQSTELAAECSASPASAACVSGAALPVIRAAEVVSVVVSQRSVVPQEPIVKASSIMVVNGVVASQMVDSLAAAVGSIRNTLAFRTHFEADPLWAYRVMEEAVVEQALISPLWMDHKAMFETMYAALPAAHMEWLASQTR